MRLVLFVVILLTVSSAHATLKIDINRGNASKIKLILVQCTQEDHNKGSIIANIVAADLASTGFLDVQPNTEIKCNANASISNFGTLRDTDNLILSLAVSLSEDGKLTVKYRAIDTSIRKQILGKLLESNAQNHRKVAHSIADSIYTKLTGDVGYFNTSIAHTSEIDGKKRLAIMDQDGANLRFITDGRFLVLTPRFSPDGSKIVYMSYSKLQGKVFIKDLEKRKDTMVGNFKGVVSAPRFSPDGKSVILATSNGANTDIHRVYLHNNVQKKLTVHSAINTSPSYSPDQTRIVFTSDRSGSPQLYTMNANGASQKRISFGGGSYTAPVWSPRGDLIAFTTVRNRQFYIGVMKPDGSGERILATGHLVEGPTWAPNGRLIAFTREERSVNGKRSISKIYSIDITGKNERLLPTKHNASDPSWSDEIEY
ncbi:tol-Pal system beta propeller repeat protein TolB [Neorickettsia helminthoeca str. Oregon]|uniref:Tol-Pal system protein TolB n=1 Tax=Neorickettsia helminthoeca str. Oregon TaxID=1286528 RepID=X5H560_9RICK|nr:Tol-Pal system beta propeller repeat protein TolB [Neorickettsia helminthoeca]AHX11716.1 tol-Pal system beta propeller repeat protein TolB [Neorickettsia helminthoeca str. Oregon]